MSQIVLQVLFEITLSRRRRSPVRFLVRCRTKFHTTIVKRGVNNDVAFAGCTKVVQKSKVRMEAQSESLGTVGGSCDQRDLREEHLADQIWQLADLVDEGDRERRLLLRTVMTMKAELVQLKETVRFMAERLETVPDSPVRADVFTSTEPGLFLAPVPSMSELRWSESQQVYLE